MESVDETTALMDLFPYFRELAPQRRQRVAPLLKVVHFPKGATLFRQGDPGETMYFLCRGRVAFSIEDAGGKALLLEEAVAGGFFGEVALFGQQRRATGATVVHDVEALALHRSALPTFLEECPDAAQEILHGMARRLSQSSHLLSLADSRVGEEIEKRRGATERFVDRWIPIFASPWFLVINLLSITIAYRYGFFDSSPLDRLGLVLAVEALVITTLVLNGQMLDERDMRIRDRVLEARSMQLQEQVDELSAQVQALTQALRARE